MDDLTKRMKSTLGFGVISRGSSDHEYMIAESQFKEAADRIESLTARVEELKSLAFTAYCAGYEVAHNDTVEGMYSPPSEYPEEWAERREELLSNLLTPPEISE